jgi:hypothetical protein
MTEALPNVVNTVIRAGAQVRVNKPLRGQYRISTNNRFDITQDEVLVVTRVYTHSLIVRTTEPREIAANYYTPATRSNISFQISREDLQLADGNYTPPPPPRRLGKKPEGDEFIDIDHPGIQWLWDDMGEYADKQGYCSQYDALCVKLGIPGRPRDFSVTTVINGLSLSTTVKARSQKEANELVRAAIKTVKNEEPEPTPPAPEFPLAA